MHFRVPTRFTLRKEENHGDGNLLQLSCMSETLPPLWYAPKQPYVSSAGMGCAVDGKCRRLTCLSFSLTPLVVLKKNSLLEKLRQIPLKQWNPLPKVPRGSLSLNHQNYIQDTRISHNTQKKCSQDLKSKHFPALKQNTPKTPNLNKKAN